MNDTQPATAITLEQLVALNDEIAALVRAGVPLEQGLTALGADMPGRLGKVTQMLAERMERGESLDQVMAAESSHFPLAWAFFVFFVVMIAPSLLSAFKYFDVPGRGSLVGLTRCGESVHIWGPAVPLVVLIVAAVWWYRSGRAALVEPRWSSVLLGWLPWIGRILRASRTATFVEIMALLVDAGVPLHESIVLAAEAAGDPQPERLDMSTVAIPPLVGWLMAAGRRHGTLAPSLRHAAEVYHHRAQHEAESARIFAPVLLTVVIGGSATLAYALLTFVPYISLLKAIGLP
jgi:general secretion pathway protein F